MGQLSMLSSEFEYAVPGIPTNPILNSLEQDMDAK